MKNKTSRALILAVVFAIALVSSVSAQGAVVAKSDKVMEAQANKGNSGKDSAAAVTNDATQTTTATATQETVKKEKKEKNGKFNAESHRNAVATFVQSLLAVADREGGIGQEVRVIANQQNDTKDRTADLVNAVGSRSKVKTFFIGTSYKNLGELRSQMVQTRNQIDQLKRLADRAENEGDKVELQAQIQTLEHEQASINNFITQNESQFSLFGWAVKLFRK